jgi:Bromodomain/SNF5 / SMARCB1 / INI1
MCCLAKPGKKRGRREAFFSNKSDAPKPTRRNVTEGRDNCLVEDDSTKGSSVSAMKYSQRIQNQIAHDNCSLVSSKNGRPKALNPSIFKALQIDGMSFDIDSYYCGHEKFEGNTMPVIDVARDENNAADNLFVLDSQPKSLIAQITLQFPIASTDRDTIDISDNEKSCNNKDEIHYFRDKIDWDLSDVKTPTPTLFAAQIATEYGLSFVQTRELTHSIQRQLRFFVEQNCAHVTPIAWRGILSSSPSQHVLDYKPTPLVPHLYGEIMDPIGLEGSCRPLSQKAKVQKAFRSSISSLPSDSKVVQKSKDRTSAEQDQSISIKKKSKQITKRNNSKSLGNSIKDTDIYFLEVRDRLHNESITDVQNKGVSKIEAAESCYCHLCQKEKLPCGVFPCSSNNHAFCVSHLEEKFQLGINQEQVDFCPVCTLSCDCPDCAKILDSIVVDFKQHCTSQSKTPETAIYPNLLTRRKSVSTEIDTTGSNHISRGTGISKSKAKRSLSSDKKIRSMPIKKISLSEFPREVSDGVDSDYIYESDYRALFGSAAQSLNETVISVQSADTTTFGSLVSHAPIVECNLDYCHVCANVGNLVCCDICPRAYHSQCLPAEENTIVGRVDKWECHICRRESRHLSDDKVTGDDYYTIISSAFDDLLDQNTDNGLFGLRVLSMVLDWVNCLIKYDFGYMFQNPVDTQLVQAYTSIVKRPMDLGTISSKLEQGLYKDDVRSKESCFGDIALAAFQDVELVWHNCFLFNCEGSAIYRMAEVQRKRANVLRMVSFDQYLDTFVKEELLAFITSCEKERNDMRVEAVAAGTAGTHSLQLRPKTKHKISGTALHHHKRCKPVAIFDPEAGRIVKVYTSLQTACNVVNSFFEKKFECEVLKGSVCVLKKLRAFIIQSKAEPLCTLFGYRWIFLDDLRQGRVAFSVSKKAAKKAKKLMKDFAVADEHKKGEKEDKSSSKISGFIQLTDGDKSFVFNTVEETLSFPGIQADIPSVRKQLRSLVAKLDFKDNLGRIWRLIDQSILEADAAVNISEAPMAYSSELAQPDNCRIKIVKMDLVSGSKLLYFQSIGSAFQDWLYTLDAAIEVENEKTIESFRSQYLDSSRSIDGICWKTVTTDSHAQNRRSYV